MVKVYTCFYRDSYGFFLNSKDQSPIGANAIPVNYGQNTALIFEVWIKKFMDSTQVLVLLRHRYAVLGTSRCSCLPGSFFYRQLPSDSTGSLISGRGSRPWTWPWRPARFLRRRPRAETQQPMTSIGTWLPLSSIGDQDRKWASVGAETKETCTGSQSLQPKEALHNHLSNAEARFGCVFIKCRSATYWVDEKLKDVSLATHWSAGHITTTCL